METHITDLENTVRTGNMARVSSDLTLIAGHIKKTQTAVINIITRLKRGIGYVRLGRSGWRLDPNPHT